MDMDYELGGFAEFPEDIDGDFNEFNYCLAKNYVCAMYEEDFELLGEVSLFLLEKICYWYDYDDSFGNKGEIERIKNGTFKTFKNRTFIEAIFDNKNANFAETYIFNKVYDPKLILTIVLDDEDLYEAYIQETEQGKTQKIINDLYEEIEKQFISCENKLAFLKKIREGIKRVHLYNGFKQKPIFEYEYSWVKAIKKGSV